MSLQCPIVSSPDRAQRSASAAGTARNQPDMPYELRTFGGLLHPYSGTGAGRRVPGEPARRCNVAVGVACRSEYRRDFDFGVAAARRSLCGIFDGNLAGSGRLPQPTSRSTRRPRRTPNLWRTSSVPPAPHRKICFLSGSVAPPVSAHWCRCARVNSPTPRRSCSPQSELVSDGQRDRRAHRSASPAVGASKSRWSKLHSQCDLVALALSRGKAA